MIPVSHPGCIRNLWSRRAAWALAALVLVMFPEAGRLWAQEDPSEADLPPFRAERIMAGFDSGLSVRRENCWIPFTIILTNESEAISGDLVIAVHGTEVRYHTPVEMPSASKKVVRMAVMPLSDTDEYSINFARAGGFLNTELAMNLSVIPTDPRVDIIGLLSGTRGSHPRLGLLDPGGQGSRRRVLYSDSINLPEHWPAYANIDALVWDGRSPTEFAGGLTEAQYEALYTWIQMGGHLVLALGENWGEISGTPWERLLPVTYDGSQIMPADSTVTWPGAQEPITLGRDAVIAVSSGQLMADAVVALRVKSPSADDAAVGLPLVIRRKVGAGAIDTLTVSLAGKDPLLNPQAYDDDLIDILVSPEGRLPVSAAKELEQTAAGFLSTQVQAELPSAWFIAGFLGVYIFLAVPVNYFIFRKIGRLEWAWFMVPVWAVIFAVAAYYIGAIHQRGQVTLAEFSVVEAAPSSPFGRASSLVALYSPVRGRYNVSCSGETGFFSPHSVLEDPAARPGMTQVNRAALEPMSVRYGEESGAVLENILVYHWSQKTLKVMHHVPLGEGIEVDLSWKGPEEITGKVSNLTNLTLHDVCVVTGNTVFKIGTLPPGQLGSPSEGSPVISWQNDPNFMFQTKGGQSQNWSNFRDNPAQWMSEQVLPRYITAMFDDDYGESMSFVIAFVEEPLLKDASGKTSLAVGRSVGEHFGRALIAVPFTVQTSRNFEAAVPAGAWHAKAVDSLSGFDVPGEVLLEGRGNTSAPHEIAVFCQVDLKGVDVDALRIQMGFVESERSMMMGNRGGMQGMANMPHQMAKPGTLNTLQVEMRHWRTHEWEPVAFEIAGERIIDAGKVRDILIVPGRAEDFVDRRERSIRFRISNGSAKALILPLDSVRASMNISSGLRLPKTLEEACRLKGL